MGKQQHLIRVEGVNHLAVLDDTNDISTRRGASAMLRDVPASLPKRFPILQVVSLEASVGLFNAESDDPDGLVASIAEHLAAEVPQITFVVDVVPLGQDFRAALHAVKSRNRFRQFRQLTLAVPAETDAGPGICELDRVRPAAAEITQGSTKRHVSESVGARRKVGRNERRDFLRRVLELPSQVPTTRSLLDLAADPELRFGNLAGKMAVLYMDGNGFGRIKQRLENAPNAMLAFDARVQGLHKRFLADLVQSAMSDEHFLNGQDLRLETLLWGGDELMLVVPAWKGMATLQRFFETVEDAEEENRAAAEPPGGKSVTGDESLSYAAGLVFCSANTPIAQIVRTAKELAEAVKRVEHGLNRFDYLVLESVDYPTQKIQQFRSSHFGDGAARGLEPLAPLTSGSRTDGLEHTPWQRRIVETAAFLESCPRRSIRALALEWCRMRNAPTDPSARDAFRSSVNRFLEVNKKPLVDQLYQRLFNHLVPGSAQTQNHDHGGWLHLTELWDYLAPLPRKLRAGQ